MNLNLTWFEKFTHLHEIDPNIAIKMNPKKLWYVSTQLRLLRGDGLLDIIAAYAKTPEQCVDNYWETAVVKLANDSKLILGINDKTSFKWEGSRWLKI